MWCMRQSERLFLGWWLHANLCCTLSTTYLYAFTQSIAPFNPKQTSQVLDCPSTHCQCDMSLERLLQLWSVMSCLWLFLSCKMTCGLCWQPLFTEPFKTWMQRSAPTTFGSSRPFPLSPQIQPLSSLFASSSCVNDLQRLCQEKNPAVSPWHCVCWSLRRLEPGRIWMLPGPWSSWGLMWPLWSPCGCDGASGPAGNSPIKKPQVGGWVNGQGGKCWMQYVDIQLCPDYVAWWRSSVVMSRDHSSIWCLQPVLPKSHSNSVFSPSRVWATTLSFKCTFRCFELLQRIAWSGKAKHIYLNKRPPFCTVAHDSSLKALRSQHVCRFDVDRVV